MNSDIHIIHVLSDDPLDCCPNGCSGDEFTDMVFVTVITLGVAEIVTVLVVKVVDVDFMNCVFVTDSTSVLVLVVVVVDLITCVLVVTDVTVLVTA